MYMKKILSLCFVAYFINLGYAFGQNDSLFKDSTINVSFTKMIDSCFKYVDLSQVPTGLLMEKASTSVDLAAFTGQVTDSIDASIYLLRRVYGTLHRASVDTNVVKDTMDLELLVDTMQHYLSSGKIPIAIINYKYSCIKENAFDDSLLRMDGIELYDIDEREENPYETHTCFIASAALHIIDTTVVSFIFPGHLYLSNDSRAVDFLEVDFGDGQGWQTVHFEDEVNIDYDSARMVQMKLRVHLEDDAILESTYPIKIEENVFLIGENYPKFNEYYFFISDTTFEGGTGSAHVFIHYACSNTDKKIRRPFIFAGGFHSPKEVYEAAAFKGPIIGQKFFDQIKDAWPNSYYSIISQEYDLIYVDFVKTTDYIQRNAYVLEKIINWVNNEKRANGSIAQNIVFGSSMGGLVARYSLGHMHQMHLNDLAHKPDHDTRVYYSHDSPHRGVNAPLGKQAMVKGLYNYFFTLNHFSTKEIPDVFWDYEAISCISVQQMLINNIFQNSLHTNFYNDLNSVADFDNLGCKSVAISNGSGTGVGQGVGVYGTFNWVPLLPGSLIMEYNYGSKNIWGKSSRNDIFHIWAVPDATSALTSTKVFDGYILNKINNQVLFPYYFISNATQWNGLDGMPGSLGGSNAGELSAPNIIGSLLHKPSLYADFPYQCFIPSISSTALNPSITSYTYQVNSHRNDVTFKRFITHDDVNSSISYKNWFHINFNEDNAQIFEDEMLEMAPATIAVNNAYNYGAPISDWIGTTTVNGTLSINKDEIVGPGHITLSENNPPMPDNTVYRVETLRHDQCSTISVTITVNGSLELGDANTSRSGELIIHSGSKVILEDDSYLKIYNNSKLVIEEGAELQIVGTPIILLGGANSIIEIHGKLTLDNDAQLNITSSSSGHVVFKCPSGSYCTTDIGSNCEINVTGANREDKVIKITGKGLHLQDLENFAVTTGTIELGNNTELIIDKSLHLDLVKITQTSNNTQYHQGVTINSQQGSDEVTITDCLFEYAETGLTKSSTCNLSLLTLETTAFANCSTGLYTNGNACNLNEVRFDDCVTNGWLAENMTATSNVKTYAEGNATAINYTGNSSANLYVYESTFANNTLAVSATGAHILAAQCNHFVSNTNDVYKSSGSLYLDGSHGFTPAGGGSTVYGGNNTFDNTATYSINMSSVSNLYVQGQNLFTYSVTPTKIFTGTLSGSTQALDNNQWSIYDGSTTQTSMYANMWAVVSVGWTDTYDWTGTACSSYWNGYIAIPAIFSTPETTKNQPAKKVYLSFTPIQRINCCTCTAAH